MASPKYKKSEDEVPMDGGLSAKKDEVEKTEEEVKREFLSSLMVKVTKNPITRKTQKKYHRASSDCESSGDDEPALITASREEALKISLKKAQEQKEQNRKKFY